MDAVVAFIANGEATKPVEPGERALDDPAEHAKAAAVGRAATHGAVGYVKDGVWSGNRICLYSRRLFPARE